MEEMQRCLQENMQKVAHLHAGGQVADYIPALALADSAAFGAAILHVDGSVARYGDHSVRFTIQSISKILSFICCLMDSPIARVFEKISVESSSSSFNAIADLETHDTKKPLNPMINAGAIAVMELIGGDSGAEKFERVRALARLLSESDAIDCNEAVYISEKETGDRNRSLAYYMKSTGVIEAEVSVLLEAYFRVCALEMDCVELARVGQVLARDGMDAMGRQLIPRHIVTMARTVMAMCGMYNESGRYAVEVGVPSKSGVGGGILAVVPGKMGIGIYGPALNEYGTSVCGSALMEALSEDLNLHIF